MGVMRPGGGSYKGPSFQVSHSYQPLSPAAKAAWKSAGGIATILVVLFAASSTAGAGLAALLWTPLTGVGLALSGLLAIPTNGGGFISVAIWGAVAGFVIGSLKRARLVRGRLAESFVGALFSTKSWAGPTRYAVLELSVRTIVGYTIGLCFSAQGLFGPRATTNLHAIAVVAAGAGGGGGDDGSLALAYVALWIAAIILAMIVMSVLTTAMVWVLLERLGVGAAKGAIGGAAKGLADQLAEDWGRDVTALNRRAILWAAFRRGVARGAINGAIIGGIMLLLVG
jgi:hypothetical protein